LARKNRFPDWLSGKLKISNPNITVSIILEEFLFYIIMLACLSIEIESAAGELINYSSGCKQQINKQKQITLAGERLQSLGPCFVLGAFQQGEVYTLKFPYNI
jgi:hypothetical protein